jgi:hypothetical protein
MNNISPILQSDTPTTNLGVYITPTLEKIDTNNNEEIQKFRDAVTLECQGDFVEFDSNGFFIESIIAFDAIRPVCSEVIVKNGDSAIGIYDRHHTDIIRPVKTDFIIYKDKEFTDDELLPEMQLDLTKLLEYSVGNNEYEKVNSAIDVAFEYYKPARIITLVGVAPLAVALALQNMFYGICVELWWQDSVEQNNKAIKIF